MRITLFILLIFAHYVKNMADLAIPVEKYVDQKDMSERCKRRVAPSIFLGKEVMDASSYVMRLSRLEVPYSCSVSVRAEIGFNIIMIIHLLSSESLEEACSENPNQLIVYELGETFGGYWGHMPDVMMKNTMKNYTKFYTLKTTHMSSTRTTERIDTYDEEEEDEGEDHVIDSEKLLVQSIPATTDKESDYIRVEIPLVNVSGNLQLSDPPRHTYNSEELFDFIYDVTPNNGSEYETSIMPLVQFSIKEMKGLNKDMKPRYELSYDVNGFTLDSRLTYSTKRRINIKKSNWMANRRYNLRKKMKIPYTRTNVAPTASDDMLFAPWQHFTSNSTRTTETPTPDGFYLTMPWRQFEYTFDQFNVTSPSTLIEDITLKDILNNITDMQNYLSAYPRTNLSIFHDITSTHGDLKDSFRGNPDSMYATEEVQASSAKKITKFESRFSSDLYVRENTDVVNNIRKKIVTVETSTLSQSYNENISNTHIYAKESTIKNKNTLNDDIINVNKLSTNTRNDHNLLPNGTLVNHESWENVVQSAHVMAKILNRTEINSTKLYNETLNFKNKAETSRLNKMRKKRYVKSLDIEKSRPRNLTTQQYTTSETEKVNLFDIQYLSRLVELQDDEIGGRVALRYLRNYVGGALFNICDYQEAQSQQMFLFNASRLVIAVSNMTLERMMIVLTPAFPLFGNVSRCPPEHLECQIIGSRVCIDSLNACDGIPNCGSYDIYDEDRRLCGVSKGLPHNIYIAAFSFLALLLILLYTIYYWLKRCVPRVSEAFFIFSDTSEIKLQLDTIMRSPTDVDDFSDKFVYPGNFFDDVSLQDYEEQSKKSNIFTRFCIAYCGFLLCIKKNKKNEAEEKSNKNNEFKQRPSRMYSFTELELLKYRTLKLKDEGVQTGDSIDIRVDKNINNLGQNNVRDSLTKFKLAKQNVAVDQNYSDELNLIKFSKNSKLSENDIKTKMESFKTKGLNMLPSEDEKEIKSTIYDRPSDLPKKIPVTCEVHHDVKKATTSKHLRFDESPTFIESLNVDEDITESSMAKDSFTQGNEHSNKHKLETISEEDSKDNTRFWKFKNKKQKKKHFF